MRSKLIWTALVLTAVLAGPKFGSGQAGQPLVGSVTGTVAQGAALTINGATLVSEDTSHYDSWFASHPTASSFEGASPAADGWTRRYGAGGSYVTNPKLTGSKSVHFTYTGTAGECEGDAVTLPSCPTDFYLRTYLRMHATGGWPQNEFKMLSLYGSGTLIWAPDRTAWPATMMLFYPPYQWGNGVDSDNFPSASSGGKLVADRWYCLEMHYKLTSPASWTVWWDGIQAAFVNPGTISYSSPMYFGFNNSDGPSGMVIDGYFDSMAFGSSRLYPLSLVEIGNSSDHATAKKVVQPITSMSDAVLGINADLTGLGSGPYYLWVTNNRQQLSAAFSLSTGDRPPTAPSTPIIR
jgi:hypothetical protein